MDYAAPEAVTAVVRRYAEQSDFGYGSQNYAHLLEQAFAERMQALYGWQVDPALVLPTSELIQAMYATLMVFSEPGDGVVLQTPIYPPFLVAIKDTQRRLVDSPLRDDGTRYVLDIEGVRNAIDATTRVLMVCNPHNPTGRVFDRAELHVLGDLAVQHDLVILVDEIHQDLIYAGHEHVPMATLGPEIAARTITITSATKGFNIAGLRCALMHFGSAALKERFHQVLPERLLGQVSTIGIDATVAAWRLGQPWLEAVMARLTANRDLLSQFVASELPMVRYYPPEGTYLAWLDCRALGLTPSPMQYFLEHAGVAYGEGSMFGPQGETCIRLNFACTPDVLQRALEQTATAIRTMPVRR
jgi:cystathionine beta-lyase